MDTSDTALRFRWMLDKAIITEDTPFTFGDGLDIKLITFKKECAKLCMKDGKYCCSVWDKERPDFCAIYPDDLFRGVEKWNREKIQKIMTYMKKDCPIFETITLDEVIKRLWGV